MIRFPAGYDSLNRIKRYQDYYQASYGVMLLSAGQFSPLSLFAAGEQGAWYDPSDFSTMFQDSAGTTPVTAVEQPVGLLLDKRGSSISYNPATMTISSYDGGGATTIVRAGANLTFTSAASGDGIRFNAITVADNYAVIEFIASGSGSLLVYAGAAPLAVTLTGTPTAYRTATHPNTAAFTIFRSNSAGLSASITINSVYAIRGNHASQSTDASRPVLSARVNLLTYSEQFDNAAWTKGAILAFGSGSVANATEAPNGTITADFLVPNTTLTNHAPYFLSSLSAGVSYTASIYAKVGGYDKVVISDWNEGTRIATFDLTNVTAILSGSGATVTLANPVITSVGNGWYRCSVQITKSTSGQLAYFINSAASYAGNGTSGLYLWGADLRVTNVGVNLPAYQRVAAATDYDTSGFPLYLKFDGVDDSLATGTIDFSATDKMSVFAGVRKLSDAAGGEIVSLGNITSVNGSFELRGPRAAAPNYMFGSRGTSFADANIASGYSAPITNVVTGIADISVDLCALRINGTVVASPTTDQGTGNYSSGVVFVGRLGGTALSFNGNLYSLIVRGALSTNAQIASTETYVNSKTGAY